MYAAVLNGGGPHTRESQRGNFREGLNRDNEDAAHIPITKLVIGSWSIVAKYDEHVLLSFYWAERKVVWEVLHLGVVRKMEVDFDDVTGAVLSPVSGSDAERLVLELARPPRFYRETQASTDDSTAVNYVYTTDFTNGQASQVQRHSLLFSSCAASKHAGTMKAAGLPLRVEGGAMALGDSSGRLDGALRSPVGALALAARLRKPPTSSPRLDAIILQEQLEREMRECQARYTGICPVRDRIYTAAFDELIVAIGKDEPKRGMMLRRVRDEAKLSCDNYRTVFEKSVNFGCIKLSCACSLPQ
uniref:TRF2/HOY1 PH-like domain-containing protein n=1 Tax=Chrysotila carterae TaxID=13221 RepID=A0A7S4BM71_CHRCT